MSQRRGRKFIDFQVQSSLALRLCLHWAFFLIATSFAMFVWIRLVESPAGSSEELRQRFLSNFIPLMIVSAALLPIFILDCIKLSNRFAGPIYRLQRALSSLADGQSVRPLEFRDNDFWKALAADFNRAMLPDLQAPTPSSPQSPQK